VIRVYLLEDNDGLREDTTFALNAEGLVVRGAANGLDFADLCANELPDVAVIDRMLPGEDGLSIARSLRAPTVAKKIGIVFLTSLGALNQKLEGLEFGDAYLVKPVDMRELAAVIRSVYRRMNFSGQGEKQGTWRLHLRRLELVSPQGQVIQLSLNEARILLALSKASGNMVSARKLVEVLGEDWMQYEKNRLELLLSRLRQKIRATKELGINPIKSVRNEGYQMTIVLSVENA
jgi:DNA-binding response OmpR family regulator